MTVMFYGVFLPQLKNSEKSKECIFSTLHINQLRALALVIMTLQL